MRHAVYLSVAILTALAFSPVGSSAQPSQTDVEARVSETIEALLGAIRLPEVMADARGEGVADSTLIGLIEEFRGRNVPAAEAESILEQEVEVLRGGGPPDRFGAFVRSQLDAGLRGRDLAAAIRAEHRARGIGIPERRPERSMRGRGGERGGPAARGPRDEAGDSAARGAPPGRGQGRRPRGQGGAP